MITDKTRPYTPRRRKMTALAGEIAAALREQPDLQILLGHGSGSFGHQAASRSNTRNGVSGRQGWNDFAEVWYQASHLNRLVVEALRKAGIPAVTISPFSSITTSNGKIMKWDHAHVQYALDHGLLPVIHGDVFFDDLLGGTILSTEELFEHLALELHPARLLLAGLETGVWQEYPKRNILLKEITPASFTNLQPSLGVSAGTDVTGGMQAKISRMLSLVQQLPGMEVLVFSGRKSGNILRALYGRRLGTVLHC